MSWVEIDADALTVDAATSWSGGPRASAAGDGAVITAGRHTALIGPSGALDDWLTDRLGSDAPLVGELACFVYHRKGWFAGDRDPLTLRDRRPGQYELRVLTDVRGTAVPLFAIDFAPVRHRGTFATLDQRASNAASSLTEIAAVSADQAVRIDGHERPLAGLACGTDRLWEASRLGSISELVRLTPTPAERDLDAFRRLAGVVDAFTSLDAAEAAAAHTAGRALFGVALGWAIARLPIDLILGLSQGTVVRVFTALVTGGDRHYSPLDLDGWHEDAPAFRYAPGYFATGEVVGYSLDAVSMQRDVLALGLRRLERLATSA